MTETTSFRSIDVSGLLMSSKQKGQVWLNEGIQISKQIFTVALELWHTNPSFRAGVYSFAVLAGIPLAIFLLYVVIMLFVVTSIISLVWIGTVAFSITIGAMVLAPFVIGALFVAVFVTGGHRLYLYYDSEKPKKNKTQ